MPGSDRIPLPPTTARHAALLAALVACAAVLLTACGGGGSKHSASDSSSGAASPGFHRSGPEAIFTAGYALLDNPDETVVELRDLGVDRVRVFLNWHAIAPDATSATRPSFDATNPAAYPAHNWAVFDRILKDIAGAGMTSDVVLAGPPPLWASGPGRPAPTHGDPHPYWKPQAALFQQFVKAAGTRYSGHYRPRGAAAPLPRVDFWSVWNEPNIGANLAPAMTHSYSKIEVSPHYYRMLVGAAWTGLHATGHGADTLLIGEVGPAGSTVAGAPGLYAAMPPLEFIDALYCVGADNKPLRGTQATERGCPGTSAQAAGFVKQNPGLFQATGFADHPYSFTNLPPDKHVPNTPDYTNLANIPALESTLDRDLGAYGSHRRLPIWSTEYGYITNPPNHQYSVTPALAARYLNWAEYISWRNTRIRSYDQYLLQDSSSQGFASGLKTAQGVAKPTYAAYRMPIWLPVTSAAKGTPLEVWGAARPARMVPDASRPPLKIQFRPASGGDWRTVATESTRGVDHYVDVRHTFPSSGSVRITWHQPQGPTFDSRVTRITIH